MRANGWLPPEERKLAKAARRRENKAARVEKEKEKFRHWRAADRERRKAQRKREGKKRKERKEAELTELAADGRIDPLLGELARNQLILEELARNHESEAGSWGL